MNSRLEKYLSQKRTKICISLNKISLIKKILRHPTQFYEMTDDMIVLTLLNQGKITTYK